MRGCRKAQRHAFEDEVADSPDGFDVVTDVLSQQELEDIAANYKRVAGFQVEGLNAKPPIVTMPDPAQLSSAGSWETGI